MFAIKKKLPTTLYVVRVEYYTDTLGAILRTEHLILGLPGYGQSKRLIKVMATRQYCQVVKACMGGIEERRAIND